MSHLASQPVTAAIVPAVWNDGKTAVPHPVLLERVPEARSADTGECGADTRAQAAGSICLREPIALPGGQFRAAPGEPLAVWPLDAVQSLEGKLNRGTRAPVRLVLDPDDGQRLVLHSREAIDTVAGWLAPGQGVRKKRRLRNWVYGTAAVWLACACLYLASPVIFSTAALLIPRQWEESMGESSLDTVLQALSMLSLSQGTCAKGSGSPDLAALMQRLEKAGGTEGYSFRVTVLHADFVNAFALPGGYLVVSTGLIRACESPDELAGVLAHEMAHVTARHGTTRMLRYYTWASVLKLFGGSDSTLGNISLSFITSGFDRDDEREADRLGVIRLVRAGIDPEGLRAFFARLQKDEGDRDEDDWEMLSYVGSHPQLKERRKNIETSRREAISLLDSADREAACTPAMSPEAWKRLRALCPEHSGK